MRIIFTLCIVFQSLFSFAQDFGTPRPRILVLDTTLNLAPAFNNAVVKYAPGFRFIGADNSEKGKVYFSYTDGRGGILRLEYRCVNSKGRPLVVYQSITADLDVIVPIINGLFGTNMGSSVQNATSVTGPIEYRGKEYQCVMQPDEYKAGYWVLSFLKS